MPDLKKQLIRLGATNPELQEHIRPILAATKPKPTLEFIRTKINQYSVKDDPYDVAEDLGKDYGWTQKQIYRAEELIRKHFIK